MKILLLFVAVSLTFGLGVGEAPLVGDDDENFIENEYIVVFKGTSDLHLQSRHIRSVNGSLVRPSNPVGFKHMLMYTYDTPSLKGYAVRCDKKVLAEIRSSPEVEFVSKNRPLYLQNRYSRPKPPCRQQNRASWNLARTSNSHLELALTRRTFRYEQTAGEDVNVYIVDTGIFTGHVDFQGRARWGIDTVEQSGSSRTDTLGHGTHVAGTVASRTFGVAKRATVVAVKVFDDSGRTSEAAVLDGLRWVSRDYRRSGRPAVINLSIGGSGSYWGLNRAIRSLTRMGIVCVVAAGNSEMNACSYSPAMVSESITVGNTNENDERMESSNFGRCVDIFAPGTNIRSLGISSPYSTYTDTGTSMSAPLVAGMAARWLSLFPHATPSQVKSAILRTSLKEMIANAQGTPNRLLHMAC